MCDRTGHYAIDCSVVPKKNGPYKAGAAQHGAEIPCIQDNQLLLADGTKLPIVKSGGSVIENKEGKKMPLVKGIVGTHMVDTLRDTGCSGVVVRKKFVNGDQYTGKYCYILLIDNNCPASPNSQDPGGCPI